MVSSLFPRAPARARDENPKLNHLDRFQAERSRFTRRHHGWNNRDESMSSSPVNDRTFSRNVLRTKSVHSATNDSR